MFVVEGGRRAARACTRCKASAAGSLYVDPALRAGSQVVTEGRALLKDGDRVEAKLEAAHTVASDAGVAGRRP